MAKLPLDSTFEATPQPSESKGSLGAQRIRETRENFRYPMQSTLNVGSVASGYTNDGRQNHGAGRVYVGSALPTTMLKPDGTTALTTAEMPSGTLATGAAISAALGVTDVGAVLVDTSGVYTRIHYWNGTAWTGTVPTWNGFINGQFKVNQRTAFAAAETALTTKSYWFDRWYTIHTTAAGTVNRETASLPTGSVSPVGIKVIGGAACTAARLGQRLEGSRCEALGADRAANQFITISGKIRNTGASALTASLVVDTANALDNFVAVTNLVTSAALVNALAAGASQSFSLPVDIGTASAGTPALGLDIYLVTTAPAAFVATESFVVTDMQVEVGRVATKPYPEDFAEQIDLCRRFYQKTFAYGTKPTTATGILLNAIYGQTNGSGNEDVNWGMSPALRATPTTTTTYNPVSANSNWRNVSAGSDSAVAITQTGAQRTTLSATAGGNTNVLAIHASVDAEL